MEIDYKELLQKYMRHVGFFEGIDYIGTGFKNEEVFTDDEWVELNRLSEGEE